MHLFNIHRHDWFVVRVEHFNISHVERAVDGTLSVGPYSRVLWKCDCGKTHSDDRPGTWYEADFE